MLEGGGSLVLATTSRFIGPGGQEAVKTSKGDMLVYHYYDGDAAGQPIAVLAYSDGPQTAGRASARYHDELLRRPGVRRSKGR